MVWPQWRRGAPLTAGESSARGRRQTRQVVLRGKVLAAAWRGCALRDPPRGCCFWPSGSRRDAPGGFVRRLPDQSRPQCRAREAESHRRGSVASPSRACGPLSGGTADWNYVKQNSERATGRRRTTSGIDDFDIGAAGITSDGITHPHGYSVQLSQPLFEGFQNLNAIRQAKATVQAGARRLAHRRADRPARRRHRLCQCRARPGGGPLARERRQRARASSSRRPRTASMSAR